jgi:transcriptional regulator with XRE-family HTH domain
MTTAQPTPQTQVWEALKVLREKDGHSIQSLADATVDPDGKPYTRQYISLLEAGKRRPTPAVIKALARALNVPLSMLEAPRTEGDAA